MSSRAAGYWLAVVLSLQIEPTPAGAHAVLIRSSPASRAVLTQPPTRVVLWFNERIEPAFTALTVWSEEGVQVDLRDVVVGPDEPRQLSVSLPPLAPGSYTVRFRVISVDSHVVESKFSFRIKPAPGVGVRP
ncbi:MAG TPA: copper resistance CopC family protein [Methylomirabilota bacterium]|nr:copper resistance CopC family protein [Methylomirabilota bacterium]